MEKYFLIFDCDGTLVDSEELTHQALVQVIDEEFSLRLNVHELTLRLKGTNMATVLEVLKTEYRLKISDDFVQKMRQRAAALYQSELKAVPFVEKAIESLQFPRCVASNAPREKIKLTLSLTKLDRLFPQEQIYSSYDVGKWKPEPDLFLHAAKINQFLPENCIVIEDSDHGLIAAKRAGMGVVYFNSQKLSLPAELKNYAKIQQIDSMSKLKEVIEKGLIPLLHKGYDK